jgi:O-antigen/teichoic acid export membrane protein
MPEHTGSALSFLRTAKLLTTGEIVPHDTLPPQMASRAAVLVSYKAASEVAGKAAVLALLVLSARELPTASFGLLSLATTLGWMASIASDFGLQLYLGREITQSATPAVVLWPLFRLRVRVAAIALALIGALSWWLAPRSEWLAFTLVAAAPLITSVAEFLNYAYRGLGRSELESGLTFVQRAGALLLVAIGLRVSPALFTVGLALVASAIAALAVSLAITARVVNAPIGLSSLPPSSVGLNWSRWSSEVAPIGVGLVLSALYFRIDVFLLERWIGLDAVAHYSAVFRLVDAMRLLPSAVLTVVLPRLFGDRDPRFAARLAAGLTAFALMVTIVAWPIAPWLVTLTYGSAYTPAAPILQVLLLSFPLLSLNYSLTHQLIGWGEQRAYAVCCFSALVANLVLNSWLIPSHAGLGAAWATLGTEAVVTIACLAALQRSRTSR